MPRYFSAVPPALVTRYGTGTYLGAVVSIKNGQPAIDWSPDQIVEISDAELAQYMREYAGLVRDGSLAEHSKADYEAFCELAAEQADAADEARKTAEETPAVEAAKTESLNDA